MQRAPGLVEISRRDFCALAGCLGLAVTGCADEDARAIATGPLGSDDPGDPIADAAPDDPDAPPGSPDARPKPDARPTIDAKPGTPDAPPVPDAMPDAAPGPTCTGTATDVGKASAFTAGTPKLFSSGKFYVVRDAGGLYAVSSICTHEGATNGVSSGRFRCPRHGALFNFDGSIISGPVSVRLVHYAMCFLASGNLGVMTGQQVSSSTRLDA
jgi:nitrite reductase/ring-hydroxylating ferredoxin subunit